MADLADDQFVVFPRGAAPQNFDLLTTATTNAGFSPDIVVEQGGFDAQVGYVACGIGVAIVPESLSRTLHLPGVSIGN